MVMCATQVGTGPLNHPAFSGKCERRAERPLRSKRQHFLGVHAFYYCLCESAFFRSRLIAVRPRRSCAKARRALAVRKLLQRAFRPHEKAIHAHVCTYMMSEFCSAVREPSPFDPVRSRLIGGLKYKLRWSSANGSFFVRFYFFDRCWHDIQFRTRLSPLCSSMAFR